MTRSLNPETSAGTGIVELGHNRECFFDNYLFQPSGTTAKLKIHQPVFQDTIMVHDQPWEGDGCDFYNFFFDDQFPGVDGKHPKGVYRMYYLGWQMPGAEPDSKPARGITACYMESPDGIHWVRPELGILKFDGSTRNNIVLNAELNDQIDNFMVFRDDNPACPPDARYKGIGKTRGGLRCYPSPDGIHFRRGGIITGKGSFDSLNVVFWDREAGVYRGYIRGFHPAAMPNPMNESVRDISYIESKDFKKWTDPRLLVFDDGEDIPLYISREKAAPYKSIITPDELVITADTIVYVDGEVLGKPADKADAVRILKLISGRWHEVITGVTLMTADRERSFAVTTKVKF